MNKITVLILVSLLLTFSCKRKGEPLELLEQDMQKMGYSGNFDRPTNALQKAAIGVLGVKDFLSYEDDDNRIVVIDLKDAEKGLLSRDRIITILKMLEERGDVQTEGKSMDEILENMENHSYSLNNYVIFWEKDKPEDIIKALQSI